MNPMKQWIKRHLGRTAVQRPGPPVEAEDWFATFAMSVDHREDPPSELIDLTLRFAKTALDSVSLDDIAQRPYVEDFFRIWPGEHYRLLAAMMLVLKPKIAIEIGTWTGMSSLAMAKYLPEGGRLVTFDIQPWRQVEEVVLRDEDFADGRLEQRLSDLADPANIEVHGPLLESAEFFFIDGPKNGEMEYRLLENFRRLKFTHDPILVIDDIRLPNMLRLWRELRHPKLDISTFGHWSGTGLVQWRS